MTQDGGVTIHLDPHEASRIKSHRDVHLNVVLFPRYRLLGYVLLTLAVILHNRFILHHVDLAMVGRLALGYLAWCLVTWGALVLWYERLRPRLHLGSLFFALDLVAWTFAIHASGGERSWLFFVLVLRSADQVPIGPGRVLGFGVLGMLCYAGMLCAEGHPIDWGPELIKLSFLAASTCYLVLPALNTQRLRRRGAAAMRAARDTLTALNVHAAQLEQARLSAEAALQVKGEFVARVSHELRTPMSSIIGMTEMTLEGELTDAQRTKLSLVRDASHKLLSLIQNLLDFSDLERARVGLVEDRFSLREIVAQVERRCVEMARGQQLEVRCVVDSQVPDALLGDASRLQQVLANLGDNAVKFTERGYVELSTQVLSATDSKVRLLFTVSDTGIGIPQPDLQRIFDPFTQSDGSLARRHDGSGLGLTIARGLVVLMGGEMQVKSEQNVGSRFSFEVPFTVAPPSTPGP
ncbi:MAG: sensor histidine kinase [Candidatus Xenobia bacterium]